MASWEETPFGQKVALGALFVILAGGMAFRYSGPLLKERRELRAQLVSEEAELRGMRAEAGMLPEQQRAREQLERELRTAREALPDEPDTLRFVSYLVSPATRAGIELLLFEPGDVAAADKKSGLPEGVARLPIAVELRTTFPLLVRWLAHLAAATRATLVSSLKVAADPRVPERLKAVVEASAFLLEPPKAEAAAKPAAAPNPQSEIAPPQSGELPERDIPALVFAGDRPAASAPAERLDVKVLGFVGGSALLSSGAVAGEGGEVNGWKIVKVDPSAGSVTFRKGRQEQVVRVGF